MLYNNTTVRYQSDSFFYFRKQQSYKNHNGIYQTNTSKSNDDEALEISTKQRLIRNAIGWTSINMWSLISRSLLTIQSIVDSKASMAQLFLFFYRAPNLIDTSTLSLCLGLRVLNAARPRSSSSLLLLLLLHVFMWRKKKREKKVFQVHLEFRSSNEKNVNTNTASHAFMLMMEKLWNLQRCVGETSNPKIFLSQTHNARSLGTFFIRIHTFFQFLYFRFSRLEKLFETRFEIVFRLRWLLLLLCIYFPEHKRRRKRKKNSELDSILFNSFRRNRRQERKKNIKQKS